MLFQLDTLLIPVVQQNPKVTKYLKHHKHAKTTYGKSQLITLALLSGYTILEFKQDILLHIETKFGNQIEIRLIVNGLIEERSFVMLIKV